MQQTNKSNEVIRSKDQSFLNQTMLNSKKQENESNMSKQNASQYSRSNSTRFALNLNSKSAQDYPIKSQQNQHGNDISQPTLKQSLNPINYLYQFWKGQHTFLLFGFIQLGPRIHLVWNLVFWIFIVMMGAFHLIFVIPYIMNEVSIVLGLFYIVIFCLMITLTIFTQFSDPGYIPRRKMIQTIPKLHNRIDNIEDMINEKAYRMIVDMENEQSQLQKQGNQDQSQLKISGINNSKIESSFGNQLQSAKTNMHSDLVHFKKVGSINPHLYKHANFNFSNNNNNNSMMVSKKIDQTIKDSIKLDQQMQKQPSLNERNLQSKQNTENSNQVNANNEYNQVCQSQFYQQNSKNAESKLNVQQFQQAQGQVDNQEPSLQLALLRMKNPFVTVEEESSMSRKSNSKRDEWTENTQKNTNELYTYEIINDEIEQTRIQKQSQDEKNQQKISNPDQNQLSDQREKFHMHIQIENENEEENKEQDEETQKRRTIFSYIDRKASRQRISQQTQLNTVSKIDTIPNDINLESFNECKLMSNNQIQNLLQSAVLDQQTQDRQINTNSMLKDKSAESATSNNKNSNQDQNTMHQIKKQAISQSNIELQDNKNFLQVRSSGLLQESMISPKIDIDGIIRNDQPSINPYAKEQCEKQYTNYSNSKEIGNKINGSLTVDQVKKLAEMNIQKQQNADDISKIDQLDNQGQGNSKKNQQKKNNIYLFNNKQITFSNTQSNQVDDQNTQNSNKINQFTNQNSQGGTQHFKESRQKIQSQIEQYYQNKNTQHQKDFINFGDNNNPNNATQSASSVNYFHSENQAHSSHFDNQFENKIQLEHIQKVTKPNIFFNPQKCINIATLKINSNSTDTQQEINQQNKIYESIIELKKVEYEDENQVDFTESQNDQRANIFLQPKNKSQIVNCFQFNNKNDPTCQENVNQITNTQNNSVQNEQEQDAHQQFMMLSLQSNSVTPKNNSNNIIFQNNYTNSNINIFIGNKSTNLNNQAIKLNEKFSYEMAKYEQNIKRLSDSIMQQNPLNASIMRKKNETIQNKNFFDLHNQSYQITPSKNQTQIFNGRKYCVTCKIFRPPRSSHCTYCDCCVEVFDHHCKFVNNCIGKHNYKYFFSFLSLLKFTFLLQLISEILYLINKSFNSSQLNTTQIVFGIIYILIIFLSWLYVLYLWGFHVFIQYRQLTTREQLRDLECDRDPKNYFNWCQARSPIFQARIIVSDNQRYNLLEDC
ncbi:hypothetical protein ABPG72_000046 [Tetrahymena utriculariae]